MKKYLHNQTETAEIFGVTTKTLASWNIEPFRKVGREVFYYLPDVIAHRLAAQTPEGLDLTRERARLAKEQADKTALENQVRRGELANVAEVSLLWVSVVSNAKMKILSIPTKAAPLVIGNTLAGAKDVLDKLINETLTELAVTPPGTRPAP